MSLGCTQKEMTCETYCMNQPHIQCVGEWQINGVYPDCQCNYKCSVSIGELGELPPTNSSGIADLNSLPSVEERGINAGLPENEFPSQPNLN